MKGGNERERGGEKEEERTFLFFQSSFFHSFPLMSHHKDEKYVVFQYVIHIPHGEDPNFFKSKDKETQKKFEEFATSPDMEACYIYEPRYGSPSKRFDVVRVTFVLYHPKSKLYMDDHMQHIFPLKKTDYGYSNPTDVRFMSTDPSSALSINEGDTFVDSVVQFKSVTKDASKINFV